MKRHVEQHKDDEEHNGNKYLQPLAGTHLEFVLAGPLQRVAGRHLDVLGHRALGSVDIPPDVAG